MTFKFEGGKKEGAPTLDGDKTCASLEGLDLEDSTATSQRQEGAKTLQPFVYGSTVAPHVGVPPNAATTDSRVADAFKISQTFQCAAILDCCLVGLSAVSFASLWGLIYLAFIGFGLVGRAAAKTYSEGRLMLVYVVYCAVTIAGRFAVAAVFGMYLYPFEMALEVVKAFAQLWFLFIAIKFRATVRRLTPDEAKWLREGRVAIARGEMLVYV